MINKKTIKDVTNVMKTMPSVKMETFKETCLLPNMTYRTPHLKLMKVSLL